MVARSSLLRRSTPGAHPARRTSSVVAALAALAPRLVRLAHHGYSDRLLVAGLPAAPGRAGAARGAPPPLPPPGGRGAPSPVRPPPRPAGRRAGGGPARAGGPARP